MKYLLIAMFLAVSASGFAHETKGPNGGRMTDAGAYHIEMVAKSDVLDVFISDANEKPIPASGFKGVAILIVEGKSQRIALEPVGTARLSGKVASALPDQPKGVVQLTAPDGKTSQGKFN